MKVSDLTGARLDYWVAKAQGAICATWSDGKPIIFADWLSFPALQCTPAGHRKDYFRPSTDWSQGGPLIDKHRINFATIGTGPADENGREPVVAITYDGRNAMTGPTHLIAAMRAIVRDTYGEEVNENV